MNLPQARREMVQVQLRARGIGDERVLAAMGEIPREAFVPEILSAHAYEDKPLPIGFGQTISQPYTVAFMTELLELQGPEKVLEIGTGSGYQTAVLAHLARQVVSVERHPELSARAKGILLGLGLTNVSLRVGDGSVGVPDEGPFDAIMVTAAAPRVLMLLEEQLAEGGRLVIPVGQMADQDLMRVVRQGGELTRKSLGPFRFVPLIGRYGWKD